MEIITLTTDFGEGSPYVAAMKGVILAINPDVRIIDLSHQIPAQNIGYTSFFLAHAVPYFPAGTIHVIVVDPGVGSERALLHVEVQGQRLLVPDNGCWTQLARNGSPKVRRLTEARYWRQPVSATFHGRDILAPVAGQLSLGQSPELLGPKVTEWVCWQEPEPRVQEDSIIGEVVFIDHFGNLVTNIPGEALEAWSSQPARIIVGQCEIANWVHTYSQAKPGALAALISSSGRLEIAVNQGNAAQRLQARVGTLVTVQPAP